jgi:hypothetical protein
VAFQGSCESVRCSGISVTDLGDQRPEGIDRVVRSLELGVAALVDARAVERLEERALLGGEAHVGARHRGEPLLRAFRLTSLVGQHVGKDLQSPYRDRGQECVAVGEVAIGGGDGYAETTAGFGEGVLA